MVWNMIVGYHVIFGAYGFWLPNDPRGSWSDYVASWELFRYGKATKTDARQSVAYEPHNHARRIAAKQSLKYSAVLFDDEQIELVAAGFEQYFERSRLGVCDSAGSRASRGRPRAGQGRASGDSTQRRCDAGIGRSGTAPLSTSSRQSRPHPQVFRSRRMESLPRSRRCPPRNQVRKRQPRK